LRMFPAASFNSLKFCAAIPGDRSEPSYTLRVNTLTFEFPAACDRAGAASIATATIASRASNPIANRNRRSTGRAKLEFKRPPSI
jgi:hypothetical protein